jgi:ADP-ribose pyrophosphatase YjhB (NUDIX family)
VATSLLVLEAATRTRRRPSIDRSAGLEFGENALAAVARELQEEIRADIRDTRFLGLICAVDAPDALHQRSGAAVSRRPTAAAHVVRSATQDRATPGGCY